MNESENEMPTNADQPNDELREPTPTAPEPNEADTLVIPAASDTATAPTTPIQPTPIQPTPIASATTPTTPLPAAEPPATPAEPWLSASAYTFATRPAPSGPPPVRWGGIVWGALLIVLAASVLVVVSSPVRLAGVTVWLATLSPGGAVAVWVAVVGLVIVVSALLGAVGAAQRNRRRV